MITQIRILADAEPFVPFTIHLADGTQLRVPTADDIALTPSGGCIIVFGEDVRWDIDPAVMIRRVTVDQVPPPKDKTKDPDRKKS